MMQSVVGIVYLVSGTVLLMWTNSLCFDSDFYSTLNLPSLDFKYVRFLCTADKKEWFIHIEKKCRMTF